MRVIVDTNVVVSAILRALATEADFLITGDRDFSEARKLGRTKIVSVSQFDKLLCQHPA